ncbi:major facilitator superfamily domain-containing protein [Xylariomycetidae sp. FL2044]|nr:major facilitator superfamily domain-containing protein [Xylariomycetidae sp. FL2044]
MSQTQPNNVAGGGSTAPRGTREPQIITPEQCGTELGFQWAPRAKIVHLIVTFLVQVSMNLNTTLYSNAIAGMAGEFGTTEDAARWGAAGFLVAYAFGCELWAPWSEEFGRRWVLQASLSLVGIFGIVAALAPNLETVLVARVLGGLATAGGSVTLAVITDLYDPKDHGYQYAVLFIVFSSVGGSIIGPIIGGFVESQYSWRVCMWIQVIFGFAVQALHLAFVRETRSTVIMNRVAKRLRETTRVRVWGPGETSGKRISWAEVGSIWLRPFKMFVTEPIVLSLSLLSGFSDALIFMMVQSFGLVYAQWGFDSVALGLAFIPIGLGYIIAYASFFPAIKRNIREREAKPQDEHAQYEARLWWLLYTVPLLPLGLFVFAFTAAYCQPPIHWIGSMFATAMIGIANMAIYQATIDYVLRAYGPYAASATGGNGWSRDFLAGVLTPVAIPMYRNLGIFNATMVLFALSVVFCGAVYAVYWYGPVLRRKSPLAQSLAEAESRNDGHPVNSLGRDKMPGSRSRAASRNNSPDTSRAASPDASRAACPVPASSRPVSLTLTLRQSFEDIELGSVLSYGA